MSGLNFPLHTSQAQIWKLRQRGTARVIKQVFANRVHRALEEARSAVIIFHFQSKSEERDRLQLPPPRPPPPTPIIEPEGETKEKNSGQRKLSGEFSLSLPSPSTANPSLTHLSLCPLPSAQPLITFWWSLTWYRDRQGWSRMMWSQSQAVSPCDPGCAGPVIVRTYLGQEIHGLIKSYFCIPCFSDYNYTPKRIWTEALKSLGCIKARRVFWAQDNFSSDHRSC